MATKHVTPEPTFGYVSGGVVTATVIYDDLDSGLLASVYALVEAGVPPDLPLPAMPDMGERIESLVESGKLVPFDAHIAQMDELYRVDDDRADRRVCYMVWFGSRHGRGPTLKRGAIYGYFENGRRSAEQQADFPDSMSRADLSALMAEHGIRPITSRAELGASPEDVFIPESDGVRVWDLGAMWRSAAQSPSARGGVKGASDG